MKIPSLVNTRKLFVGAVIVAVIGLDAWWCLQSRGLSTPASVPTRTSAAPLPAKVATAPVPLKADPPKSNLPLLPHDGASSAQSANTPQVPIAIRTIPVTHSTRDLGDGKLTDVFDFGVIELTDGEAVQTDLGNGQTCTLTPTALPDGNIKVQMVTTDKTNGALLHRQILATTPGNQISTISSDQNGSVNWKLTPKLRGIPSASPQPLSEKTDPKGFK